MTPPIARMAWYALMIVCSLGLVALDVVSHDYSSVKYIFLALIVMLINPIRRTISLLRWLVADVSKKPELPLPLKEKVLSEQEEREQRTTEREQKTTKLEAENKLKLVNASKSWEHKNNQEVGLPSK